MLRAALSVLLLALTTIALGSDAYADESRLDLSARLELQRRIEHVYWSHRIWPEANPTPKPPLDQVLSEATLRRRALDGVIKTLALEVYFDRRITAAELVTEWNRVAENSNAPDRLREFYAALDNDSSLILETLIRPALADRLLRRAFERQRPDSEEQSFDIWLEAERPRLESRASSRGHGDPGRAIELDRGRVPESPPAPAAGPCTPDTWRPTAQDRIDRRIGHTSVFTGSEMIVWGGASQFTDVQSGGRYDPALDSWTPVVIDANTPSPRSSHVAAWTGTRMLIWGGNGNDGGVYDPGANSWSPMAIDANTPEGRSDATAVWSGSEMIVWGGRASSGITNTGGRYNPALDSWSSTAAAGAPTQRTDHSAVWADTRMIIFGGQDDENGFALDHASYNPATDSWTPLSAIGEPTPRSDHSAVWSGSRMIVWGTLDSSAADLGALYDPVANSWSTMSQSGPALYAHTAVWSGTEMVVWGGQEYSSGEQVQVGGRYNPTTDTWSGTLVGDHTPSKRVEHTAVLSSTPGATEMIVWGGGSSLSGGLYCIEGCTAPSPGEIVGVTLTHAAGITTISWPAVLATDRYDVVRGDVSTLTSTAGDFTSATDTCVANDTAALSVIDTLTPAAGNATWFLARAGNCGGNGSYDQTSTGQQGARDVEIAASAGACP